MEYRKLRVIISGGGTGGHIFPAVSIARKLKEVNPESEILFVGAQGKMEMAGKMCPPVPPPLMITRNFL